MRRKIYVSMFSSFCRNHQHHHHLRHCTDGFCSVFSLYNIAYCWPVVIPVENGSHSTHNIDNIIAPAKYCLAFVCYSKLSLNGREIVPGDTRWNCSLYYTHFKRNIHTIQNVVVAHIHFEEDWPFEGAKINGCPIRMW